jgi:hypothetical protein
MRTQQNAMDAGNVTLDDMVGPVRTPRVASSAFYCCLGEWGVHPISILSR